MALCLDANVFIQASRVRYPMDISPGFWDALLDAAPARCRIQHRGGL